MTETYHRRRVLAGVGVGLGSLAGCAEQQGPERASLADSDCP